MVQMDLYIHIYIHIIIYLDNLELNDFTFLQFPDFNLNSVNIKKPEVQHGYHKWWFGINM